MDLLPDEVTTCARQLALRAGIDVPSALSHCAEAWSQYEDPLWRTVAFRHCVEQRRSESGRGAGADRRPVPVLDEPLRGRVDRTVGDVLLPPNDEPGYEQAEARCDLASILADLDDHDLAALARVYWLGINFPKKGPTYVATMRALRRARRKADR
jgi:hypothetical protein